MSPSEVELIGQRLAEAKTCLVVIQNEDGTFTTYGRGDYEGCCIAVFQNMVRRTVREMDRPGWPPDGPPPAGDVE